MNRQHGLNILRALLVIGAASASLLCLRAQAATADISNIPMGTRSGANVAPNLMFVLDDSGSMNRNFLPDQVDDSVCKACDSGSCTTLSASCRVGMPPFYAYQFNSIYYNPAVTYNPGVNYLNASLGNVTPTAAKNNPFNTADTSTSNVAAQYRDIYWCSGSYSGTGDLTNTAICRRNGINNGANFHYQGAAGLPTTTFTTRIDRDTATPHYYNMAPREHCTDETLITCTLSTTPTGTFVVPAPVRWCRTTAAVDSATAVTGGTPRLCQALVDGTYRYPRLGTFTRVDIATGNSYPRVTTRTDCTGAVGATGCTGTQELQNFANYYSYYRTRLLTMKTVPGRVFASIGNDANSGALRTGFLTINASDSTRYLKINDFKNNAHRDAWFTKFYSITAGPSTPLREALSRVGRHFAYKTDGINSFMNDGDPMTSSCQRNYTLLTTDGYWNGPAGVNLTSTSGNISTGDDVVPTTAAGTVNETVMGVSAGAGKIAFVSDNVADTSAPIYVDRATTGTLDGINQVSVTTTPSTVLSQVICTGAGNATFGSPASTEPCGCTGIQTRIKQRTRVTSNVSNQTNGVETSTSTSSTNTYQDITACTTPLINQLSQPVPSIHHVKCVGNATATFPADGAATLTTPCGCSGVQTRIKQRTVAKVRTSTMTDAVESAISTTAGSAANTTFEDFTVCTTPLEVTTVTPTQDIEDKKCLAGNTVTFANGSTSACSCGAGQASILRRTTNTTSTQLTRDGTIVSTTAPNTSTFSTFVGCANQQVVTNKTRRTLTEQQVRTSGLTTFAPINGVAYTNAAFACAVGDSQIRTRVTEYDTTTLTTDGVVGTPTISGQTYVTTNVCKREVVQPRREEITSVFPEGNPGTTNFAASVNFPTPANANPQYTYTCTGSGTRFLAVRRRMDYNQITTTTGGVAVVTFGTRTTTFSERTSCSTGTNAGDAVALAITNNGTATNTTFTAAATTDVSPNVAGFPTTTGTNLAVTLVPNPTVGQSTGAVTVTNNSGSGGTNLAVALVPNPSTVAGASTITSTNSGTTLAITMNPNPSASVASAPTTTITGGGTPNTLADVALYYYRTDLRPSGSFSKNNVPVSGKYIAPHQHMVTFTLGLGLDGQMTYRDDYETATSGDFFKIKTAATTCLWVTGTCNWPVPINDTATAIDDLWHAAVNGRGKYFSAKVPAAVENGVKETLASINVAEGSAAAAATSTPNLTTTNNSLYSSTYRTLKWDGEIVARTLDPSTGLLNPNITWSAAGQLNARGLPASDTRIIYTFDDQTLGANATKVKPFLYANLTVAEKAHFDGKCLAANWNQCGAFPVSPDPRRDAADLGTNLVNFLRGQRGNELSADSTTGFYRRRENLLGDTVNSKPAYMPPPETEFVDAGYSTFKAANATRQKVLFVAANDGILHAFNADNGAELWGYVPKQILPNLFRLANSSYDTAHAFFVDGSPTQTDAYIGGAWKSVLVGGLNSGGRGYYALDVTDPAAPKALWEICADAALCGIVDADMGLTYGPPVIGKIGDPANPTWVAVVTSGYNNIGPGNGGGYMYVLNLATGAVLYKVGTTISGTNVGDATTPSGMARIAAFVDNFISDNTIKYIYGGDLLGNMWRFDMAPAALAIPAAPTVVRLAQLKDAGLRPQSITTRPELTKFNTGFTAVYVGTGRFLGEKDIGDPAALTPAQPFSYQQTIYGFKDTGADLGNLRLPAANTVQQTLTVVDAATRSISNNAVNWDIKNGWYVDMNPANDSPGERVNIDLQLVRGTLVAIANEPNSEECSSGGDSFLYQLRYDNGSFVPGTPGNVVGTKIGNTLSVGIVVYQTLPGQIKSVITTSDGKLPQASISTVGGGGAPVRAAWRELLDDRTQ